MIKATATFYALIITLLMGLVCSGLILFVFLNNKSTKQFLRKAELQQRVNDAAKFISSTRDYPLSPSPLEMKEFSDKNFNLSFTNFNWGIYRVSSIKGNSGKLNYNRSVLTGWPSIVYLPNTIYATNHNQPLYLSGNTLIKGVLCMSGAGVKRARFDAVGFTREKLYEGDLTISSDSMPVSFSELYNANINLSHGKFAESDSIVKITSAEQPNIKHSFSKPTLVLYFEDTARLENVRLSGNIIVYSEKSILISKDSKLSGIILISPDIQVGPSLIGDCQLISNDQITVLKGANLTYPSAIIHLDDGNQDGLGKFVFIDSLACISGSVFLISKNSRLSTSLLTVESGAKITGAVYAVSRVDLRGTISGSLYLDKFVSITSSFYKENALIDATVQPGEKFRYFAGPRPDNMFTHSLVAKWLE